VPNRHNYILWLKDLLDSSSLSYSEQYEPERRVTGLDIGTGASLIYPLLGCTQRSWHFIATDVDAESLASARVNARINHLESRIRIVGRAISDPLIPLDELDISSIDFAMVNPPFYTSDTELLELAAQKSRPPSSACTGAPVEMVCEGGEVGFVQRMINESLGLKERVQWYTAMLGKQSSLEVLVDTLKKNKINNFAATAFVQGNKTRRWALGWSFVTRRPSVVASRGCVPAALKRILPLATAIAIYGPSRFHTNAIPLLKTILYDMMESLDLCSWIWDEQRLRGVGFADGNVWSRAYRRKRAGENGPLQQETVIPPLDVRTCAFGFSISIQAGDADKSSGSPAVILRWLQGDDYSLFESFTGAVQRRLRTDDAPRSV
jgi:23S rRNA (adenine1618-N6)-methyltransferase